MINGEKVMAQLSPLPFQGYESSSLNLNQVCACLVGRANINI
jgi:hypothetical protein